MDNLKKNWKQEITHEIHWFLIYFTFFALFLSSLVLYRRLILAEYAISYFHYSYGIFEALILSKIILLGQRFKLGERFSDSSLIIPTFYKTVIFTFFALIFSTLEHFITGFLHGKDIAEIYQKFMNEGMYEVLASILVIFLVFILFFAFVETGRVLGENKLINLFFYRKAIDDKKLL